MARVQERLGPNCGVTLLLAYLLSVSGTFAQCATCRQDRHTVRLAAGVVPRFLKEHGFPPAPKVALGALPDGPIIVSVTADESGSVCSATLVGLRSSPLAAFIEAAVRTWRFQPPLYKGKPLCLSSRLYIYLRKDRGRVMFLLAGVDKPKKNPGI